MGVRMKTCTKCNQTKDFGQFYRLTAGKDGRNPRCIECVREDLNAGKMRTTKKVVKFPESQGVSSDEEEQIETSLIDALRQIQNQYDVDIYASVRAGLVDRFSVVRRVQK